MTYAAPGGSAVAYDLSTVAYTGPLGSAVALSVPAIPYTSPTGSGIILNLQGSYTPPAGNNIGFDADPPPAVYASGAESFHVTDAADAVTVVIYNVGVSESFSIADTTNQTYTLVYNASIVESMTTTDSSTSELHLPVAISESFAVTDTANFTVNLLKNVAETFAIREQVTNDRSTSATTVESFTLIDEQDFNPFPVEATGINFDWRINHLNYVPPAGSALNFEIPSEGQYFYSPDNLYDHSLPAQLPDLPGVMVAGGDPYWSNVVLNIDFKPISGHSDWYTDTSLSAHAISTYHVYCTTVQSRFGVGYGVADLAGAYSRPNAYIYADDSPDWWFGSNPFTIDVSVQWRTDLWGNQAFICQWGGSSECGWWMGYIYGKLGFHWSTDGYNNFWLEVPFTPEIGRWYDISVDRDATGTLRLYVDTDVIGTIPCPDAIFDSNRRMMIGCDDNGGLFDHVTFEGYVGAARLTKGQARYSGVKPPLYEPYPTSAGTGASRRVGIQPTISCIPSPFPTP